MKNANKFKLSSIKKFIMRDGFQCLLLMIGKNSNNLNSLIKQRQNETREQLKTKC